MADITAEDEIIVQYQSLTIDLNGHTLTTLADKNGITVKGDGKTRTLKDSVGGGKITQATGGSSGRGVFSISGDGKQEEACGVSII